MLKVGLTGGIATGKSTVAEMFARRGAHVVRADEIGRDLMQPGTAVYDQIVQHFGREILNRDGTLDRAKLAAIAFAHDGATPRIEELNRIIHPAVIQRQDEWMNEIQRRDPRAVAMVEAALLYEAGADAHLDKIVVVTCRPEQKVERFARRMGIALEAACEEVERRSRAQWPDATKAARADFLIDNSRSEADAERQVEQVWTEFQKLLATSA